MCQARTLLRHRPTRASRGCAARAAESVVNISVCENRTCKKQGSPQILKILEDVEQEGFAVSARGCGCLGECGNGPNILISPPEVRVRGIGTPAAVFRMLREQCHINVPEESQLSLQLRLQGNRLAAQGEYDEALDAYQQALQFAPEAVAYKIHSNMSLLSLTTGDVAAALSEATAALQQAPRDFTTAKIRMVEACLAAGDLQSARQYLETAVRDDFSFRKSLVCRELEKKVQAAMLC
eukprot:jgi/Ulvmu1/2208/UM013_0054.1